MYEDRVRDGFLATVYDDGSIGFYGVAPGCRRNGINERLYEQERLGKKKGLERSGDGRSILNRHFVNVVTAKTATSLDFQTITGSGSPVVGGSAVRGRYSFPITWFVIKSDLDRSHMPQAWYAGKLPIFPATRFWAWYNTPASASGDILRFNPPQVMDDAGVRCLETYLFLILDGWTWGIRPQDATRLMRGLGFNVTNKDVRAALDSLVAKGWAKTSDRVPPKGNEFGFWRQCPTALSFRKSDSHPIHGYFSHSTDQRDAAYADLFAAFAPFLKVSDAELPVNRRVERPCIVNIPTLR